MNVTITSPFWKRRRDQIVESVIPYQWGVMNDEIDTTVPDDPAGNQLADSKSHAVANLKVAAGIHTVISLFFHIHMVQSVAGIRHCGSSKQTQGGCGGCLHFVPFSFLHGYHFGVLQLSADFFLYHLMNKIGSFRDIVFHLF